MLALEPVIVERLQQAMAGLGFAVKVVGMSAAKDRAVPPGAGLLVVVRIDDSPLSGEATTQVRLGAVWCVDICARLDPVSADRIDDCFRLAVQALHNWQVGMQRATRWGGISFQRLQPILPGQYGDGIYGLSAFFQTSASFKGQL